MKENQPHDERQPDEHRRDLGMGSWLCARVSVRLFSWSTTNATTENRRIFRGNFELTEILCLFATFGISLYERLSVSRSHAFSGPINTAKVRERERVKTTPSILSSCPALNSYHQ